MDGEVWVWVIGALVLLTLVGGAVYATIDAINEEGATKRACLAAGGEVIESSCIRRPKP